MQDMVCHGDAFVHLVLARWAGWTLSASHEPLSHARASIADTFEWSENAAIALACWAVPSSLAKNFWAHFRLRTLQIPGSKVKPAEFYSLLTDIHTEA